MTTAKQSNIMELVGKADKMTGAGYGPSVGLLGKALMVGVPTYALTRWLTPKINKQYDPHRTALASAIGSVGLAALPQLRDMYWNASRSTGLGRVTNLNALPGVVPPNAADEAQLNASGFKPVDYNAEDVQRGFNPATGVLAKQSDFSGGADYNGSLRAGKLHSPNMGKRGKTKFGAMVKCSTNLGSAPEGGSFETKPSHEESVSINDIMEHHRRRAKGKSQGKNVCLSSSDVQPTIKPSDDEVMGKIVKDGGLNTWAAKAARLAKLSAVDHVQNIKDVGAAIANNTPIHDIGAGLGEMSAGPAQYAANKPAFAAEIAKGQQAKAVRTGVKSSALARYLVEDAMDKIADSMTGLGDYMTYAPPMGASMGIPAHYTAQQIDNDPYMSPMEKAKALMIIEQASNGRPGLISWRDVSRAAIGAGIGYAGATLFGKVLSGIFGGIAPSSQRRLQQAGTVAGMLVNTGVLR